MSKCDCKLVRKFALEIEKLMHILCPTNIANKKKEKRKRKTNKQTKYMNPYESLSASKLFVIKMSLGSCFETSNYTPPPQHGHWTTSSPPKTRS